ncbi:MAG: metallophosphoesterase [Bacteroidaceae bacterium]|nr:metallophosphoesterase [Bacteroidaceae bacterium]
MKKITYFLSFLALLLGTTAVAQDSERLTFGVISDVHFDNGNMGGAMVKVPQALKNLTSQAKLDALAIAGDLADAGRVDQYEMLVSVFNDEANYTNPVGDLLFMMGNHDHGDANGVSNYQNGLSIFNGGEPYPLHQYKIIKGYPFITISMMSTGGSGAYPADVKKQLDDWLKQASEECPGKPIFVFTHVPPQWTVYGSWPEFENGSTWGMPDLNSVLNKYPQAVVFAGHSHYPIGDPRSIHQGANPESAHQNYFTSINTGSTTYGEIYPGAIDEGIYPNGIFFVTEGMIISELENGDIEIRRYDTFRNVEINPDKRWLLKAPFDGTMFEYADIRDADDNPNNVPLRNGLPAPAFTENAEINVEFDGDKANVSIPQATDDDCVFRYRFRVFRNGMCISEKFFSSQFYLNIHMPTILTQTINNLSSDTEYTIEVVAYDSYDNTSEPLVKTFKTPSGISDMTPNAQWKFENPSDLLKPEAGQFTMLPITLDGMSNVTIAESLEEAGITVAEGPAEGNGAIFVPRFSGLKMLRPGGATPTIDYTIMWYIKMPDAFNYNSLWQANENNADDGDFFVYHNKVGMNAMGGYFGEINDNTWYRIFMTNRNGDVHVYIDGTQVVNCPSESRWEIAPWGIYFFTDEDVEMTDTYVAELSYWERSLSENEIREVCGLGPLVEEPFVTIANQNIKVMEKLEFSVTINANVPVSFELPDWIEGVDIAPFSGKHDYIFRAQPMEDSGRRNDVIIVSAQGVEPQEINVEQILTGDDLPEPFGWWTFDNPDDLMREETGYGSATLTPAFKGSNGPERTSDISTAGISIVPGPTKDNGAIKVPKDSYLWLTTTTGLPQMQNFTILYDVMLNDVSGYKSMFQGDIANTHDAGFFFKNNQLGRGGNLEYAGDFQTGVWYRILFVMKDGCPALYVNGEKLSEYNRPVDYDFILNDEALLFADEDGEEGIINVASIRFWDIPLSADMAKKLGDSYSDVEKLFVVQTSNVRLIDKTLFSINVNANVPFTFEVPEWIEPLDVEPVEGEKEYEFCAQPLEQEGRREGVIIVEAEDFDPVEIPVIQIKLGEGMPDPTGVWTFDNPNDLLVGTGVATLQAAHAGDNGEPEITDLLTADITPVDGPLDGNGAISIYDGSYLWLINNSGSAELKDFSIQFDIRPRTLQNPNALYQADVQNNRDAGLFINKGMIGRGSNGLDYHGELIYMKWHRVFFVVRDGYASVYLDGEKVGQSTSASTIWSMYPEVLLFADENGEETYNEVAEIRYWDVPLSDEQVMSLGGVEQEWEDDPFDDPIGIWTFDDPNDLMAGTGTATLKGAARGPEGRPVEVEDLASIGIVPIEGPSAGNGAINVPFNSYLQLAHNQEQSVLNSFTFMMDIRQETLQGYNVIFQTDMSNSVDACLFTKDKQIGINTGGLGYANGLEEGKWQRLIVVVNNNAMTGIYLDGLKVNGTYGTAEKWALQQLCYLFADENGEERPIDIAELQFWDVPITGVQAKALGAAGTKTDIQQIPTSLKMPAGIYDLMGRKISMPKSKLPKGLYIINGNKVLVK